MNCNKTRNQNQNLKEDREQKAEKCPRCESTNTKFCYYNNYSKSQPRYLCKACKRHWTQGGTLRNVPVGGARKNKRLKTSSASATAIASASAMPAAQPHNVSAPTSPAIDPSILPQNTGLQYPFPGSSSSSLDSLQSSGVYDSVKETMMDEFPWRMEGSRSYSWNWDEVDALVSTTELSVPWDIDDSEIKIKP